MRLELLTVTEAAAGAAGRFTRGGFTTAYDGIVGPWFLSTFAAATGLDQLDYVVLLPPLETCISRVNTRSNHGFRDPRATQQMHEQFAHADIDSRHVIIDTSPEASLIALDVVDAQATGRLRYAIA